MNLQGGAKVALSPSFPQLRTLVRALIYKGETIFWDELNKRASQLHVYFGGHAYDSRPENYTALMKLQKHNQDSILRYGLGVRLADDIFTIGELG